MKVQLQTIFLLFLLQPIIVIAQEEKQPDKEELFLKAQRLYYQKKFYLARQLFKQVLNIDPENGRALSYMGDIQLITGKLKEAEDTFHMAAESTTSPFRELYRLGQVRYLQNDAQGAIKFYNRAYNQKKDLHIVHFQLGVVYYNLLQNKEKTIEHWEKFRKLAPDDPQGPEIDRALAILKRKDFKFKPKPAQTTLCQVVPAGSSPCGVGGSGGQTGGSGADAPELPKGEHSRVPYKKADPAEEKVNNEMEDIIEIDDL